ncbi:protein kinase domain-containing protein [Legionella brunensis]|uniref:Serine/threonine protein kinase n=1 Tax=Legionella brunensis TaxID=29422 RepID=A0A0W0S0H5_9GAMM|nr:protein kinase [Legionella brunensis]KTC76827.1 serine/threonine protein kinase [Legionella brunensis]
MGETANVNKGQRGTLFPVKKDNGETLYYFSDFSEDLGSGGAGDVYKGYLCHIKVPKSVSIPTAINKDELIIDEHAPVAIKLYKNGQTPSSHRQLNGSVLVHKDGRVILIREFIDGFQIQPDIEDNPQIKELTFFQAVDIAWQLVISLNELHYNNTKGRSIVHGDVKGSNVIIRIVNLVKLAHQANDAPQLKIDVFYLDDDFSKPILRSRQTSQGTPEHLALEVLDGLYSEESDFYALGPLLFSLFGAKNPFKEIFEFRKSHPTMKPEDLVRHYIEIGFCAEGLFEHFASKPDDLILNLVKNFLKQIVAKDKHQRPSPDAILEFFTALRQWCLACQDKEAVANYRLRLIIAANDASWLKDEEQQKLFLALDKNIQTRLINLMTVKVRSQCLKICEHHDSQNNYLVHHIVKTSLQDLAHESQLREPSFLKSFFKHSVTPKELKWLLSCFEHQDYEEFFSQQKANLRKALLQCSQSEIKALVSVIVPGLENIRLLAQTQEEQII